MSKPTHREAIWQLNPLALLWAHVPHVGAAAQDPTYQILETRKQKLRRKKDRRLACLG